MEQNVFKFRVKELAHGSCDVKMLINDKEILFGAAYYLGENPISSLIKACSVLIIGKEDECDCEEWGEMNTMYSIHMKLDDKKHFV